MRTSREPRAHELRAQQATLRAAAEPARRTDEDNAVRFLNRLFNRLHRVPTDLKQDGYHQLPHTFQSPTPRKPVNKEKWEKCDGCARLIPVEQDHLLHSDNTLTLAGTSTYVCPFCSHCHVGTPSLWNGDIRAQKTCHACKAGLSNEYQCPQCRYPRGWARVICPYCNHEQPVFAPHLVVMCDVFRLECVACESSFLSLCIC